MEQLSGTDSYFLYTERGNVYNHVASLGIYDPATAPGGKVRFKDILRHFGHRLEASPLFRRRLVTVPHGVDRPYWIDDPDLDLEFHVRHVALPEPGDWRQLMIEVARIHSRPLDRSHPLWEVYVIDGLDRISGLPKGCFAIFLKIDHAALDGQAGVALLRAIHSLVPDVDPADHDAATLYAEREPTAIELYTRAMTHGMGRASGISKLYAATLGRIAGVTFDQMSRKIRPGASDDGWELRGFNQAPLTRFNGPVSANRVLEAVALPLHRMQAARRKLSDATINDLFLTVVGGALRRYLASKDELPTLSLVALMPIDIRDDNNARAPGNQIGGMPVPVHSENADPIARLRAVHADVRAALRSADTIGRGFMKAALDALPHAVAEAFVRYILIPQLNVTVSNIRGPEATLYVAGARLVHFYPVSIATDHVGLNHTGFSYNGVLWISAVSCRNMMPDPGFYADCLRASFEELMAAIEALPEPRAIRTAARSTRVPRARDPRVAASGSPPAVASARERAPREPSPKKPRARTRTGH